MSQKPTTFANYSSPSTKPTSFFSFVPPAGTGTGSTPGGPFVGHPKPPVPISSVFGTGSTASTNINPQPVTPGTTIPPFSTQATPAVFSTQAPTTNSIFNGGITGQRPVVNITGAGTTTSNFNKFDHKKQECIEEFLRKALLGEELVNTQFHLFSAKSSSSGRVIKPRFLCANNVLLTKSSKYFLDVLDKNTVDSSLVELLDEGDVPNNARIDDYGYESDSDLEDYDKPIPKMSKGQNLSASPSQTSTETGPKVTGDASKPVASDTLSPDQSGDESSSVNKDEVTSLASSETAIQDTPDNRTSSIQAAKRPLGIRRVLVTDSAFQTWYTLLNYLYTNRIDFLPLKSTRFPGPQSWESSSLDQPKCSAKSMYRLASKVGLDPLRDKAFSYIRSNLAEYNILKELSSSLVSKHPQLLEMELDVLYSNIASPLVVTNFPHFARRIANGELAHGADIIIGIHTRLLKVPRLKENCPEPKNDNASKKTGVVPPAKEVGKQF